MTKFGMVHGRFQAFHNEHLSYIESGLEKCNHLIVGITNPEPEEYIHDEASSHRHLLEANPFSFFERAEVISRAINDRGFISSNFSIVPFHLFHDHKWQYYLPNPKQVTQFVRIFSDWEQKKFDRFEKYGFNVMQIDNGRKKHISGSEVREKIRSNEEWRALVPKATEDMMDLYGIERIKNNGLV